MPTGTAPQSLALLTALALAAGSLKPCRAQEPQAVRFFSIGELTLPDDANTSVINGTQPARPADWPASFYSVISGKNCSSTLVGPRALLTAAHCAANGSTVVITQNHIDYRGTCTQSGLFLLKTPDKDWSMCLMQKEVPIGAYETINTDATRINANTQLLLTGFGCVNPDGTGGNNNVYRTGPAMVVGVPTGGNDDITTSGPASICFGDSGGGAFLLLGQPQTQRVQVSVNSRALWGANGTLSTTSFLSSLSTQDALDFVGKWAAQNGVDVCGVTSGAANCR